MAGDWIKLQKDTPEKPEVLAISSRLGLDPDAVVGKLVRIWSWFDTHTINGNAESVTFAFLDRITGVTGFAEQMMLVGWLIQTGSVLTLPHFEYHNGETAKKRALVNKRVQKHRIGNAESNAISNASVTHEELPEKRREEKIVSSTTRGTRLSADATLSPEYRDFCEKTRPDLDPDQLFEGFRDYWIAQPGQKGVKLDWSATWRSWVRNQKATQATTFSRKQIALKDYI